MEFKLLIIPGGEKYARSRVPEIRREALQRGLDSSGTKEELILRLIAVDCDDHGGCPKPAEVASPVTRDQELPKESGKPCQFDGPAVDEAGGQHSPTQNSEGSPAGYEHAEPPKPSKDALDDCAASANEEGNAAAVQDAQPPSRIGGTTDRDVASKPTAVKRQKVLITRHPLELLREYTIQGRKVRFWNGNVCFDADSLHYPGSTPTPVVLQTPSGGEPSNISLACLWLLVAYQDDYDNCVTDQMLADAHARRIEAEYRDSLLNYLLGRSTSCDFIIENSALALARKGVQQAAKNRLHAEVFLAKLKSREASLLEMLSECEGSLGNSRKERQAANQRISVLLTRRCEGTRVASENSTPNRRNSRERSRRRKSS